MNITNTGTGTLSYTVSSDQTWLAATPVSGSAPQTLTVTATTGSLVAGTYTGHLTITATGSQGSPGTVTVTFVVSPPPPPQPILTVSLTALTFAATQGGGNPPAQTANVTNSGGGTLSFTLATDQTWLTALPASGSAPQTLTVMAATGSLTAGTYTGHITITATGVQGSPATVTVTFNVSPVSNSQPGDWLMIQHDPGRSGFASDENTITVSNASTLAFRWSLSVDGEVTAQPLFVGGVQISGVTHDVVIAATSGNSIYALDAATGAQLWKRNFGSQSPNCVFASGFGITGAPVIDRSAGRVYAVSDDGQLRTVSLFDGTDAAPALPLITSNTSTNKVWSGLNEFGNLLYIPTASDGCDAQPWRGRLFQVNLSGSTPVLQNTFVVVPSIAAPDGGGGIWGYAGVSIDTTVNRIYAASGQDSNIPETSTPNADSMMALDSNLNLLGAFQASLPPSYPCSGQPCDLDFASTPVVFNPPSCPTMLAAGNKNGILYVFKATDLAASAQPLQMLTLNTANDSLGSGGIGGTPAYWPAGNMLFIGDTGPGASGVHAGLVALSVQSNCTLQPAWSVALGGNDAPNSTPIVANGVVFIGEANTGTVHAYNAQTGTQLWTSGSAISGLIFAGPMVAKGAVYVGSWGSGSSFGAVTAFNVNPSSAPVLSLSPTTLSFAATQGGGNPPTQTVGVMNAGGGTLSYTLSSDQPWLTATPASGSAPQTLTVTAASGSLTAGTYTGHLTITATGAQGSPGMVTVTFVVSPPQPVLTVSPTTLSFAAVQAGGNPATQTVNVTNTGGGTLSYTLSSDQPWLTATPASGNAPQSLTVTATTGSLTAGTYTGHITIAATGAQGSPATVTATFNVASVPPPPVLAVSPTTLTFAATQGGGNPATQTVNVTNTGGGTLNFTVGADQTWLTALPASGSAPQTLTVTAKTGSLTAGTYTGHITITATGVQGSPATVTVTFNVASVPPPPTVLLGDQTIESQLDNNFNGTAEAFRSTATATGTLSSISYYLDASSTASTVTVGLYTSSGTHPSTLLTQASTSQPKAGAWNTITVPTASITAGTTYWFAILGSQSGTVQFRDRASGPCSSETSSQSTLTSLPSTWSTGQTYSDCPLSSYGQ